MPIYANLMKRLVVISAGRAVGAGARMMLYKLYPSVAVWLVLTNTQ